MNEAEASAEAADERAASLRAEGDRYEATRNLVIRIALICAILFGVFTAGQLAWGLPRLPNGNLLFTVFVAVFQGMLNALVVWGAPVLWTVFFAPRSWIMFSRRGQSWRERSGLSRSNVAGLRIMAFLTGTIVTIFAVLQIYFCVQGILALIKESRV